LGRHGAQREGFVKRSVGPFEVAERDLGIAQVFEAFTPKIRIGETLGQAGERVPAFSPSALLIKRHAELQPTVISQAMARMIVQEKRECRRCSAQVLCKTKVGRSVVRRFTREVRMIPVAHTGKII